MRQITSRQTTGRYAVVKIFPFIHAVKVEVKETFIDESKNTVTEYRWRLASDKDILELSVPIMAQHAPKNISSNNK